MACIAERVDSLDVDICVVADQNALSQSAT